MRQIHRVPQSEESYGTGHTKDRAPEDAISILCVPVLSWPSKWQPCWAVNVPSLERQYAMIGLTQTAILFPPALEAQSNHVTSSVSEWGGVGGGTPGSVATTVSP